MCASEYLSTCRHPAVKSTVRVRKTSGYRLIVLPPIPELSCEPFRGILRVNYLVRGTQARFTTCPVCFQWEVSRVHSSKPRGLQRLRRGCRLPRHTPNFRRGQKGHGNFPCFEVDMRSPTVSTRGAIGSPCFAACVAQVFAGFCGFSRGISGPPFPTPEDQVGRCTGLNSYSRPPLGAHENPTSAGSHVN